MEKNTGQDFDPNNLFKEKELEMEGRREARQTEGHDFAMVLECAERGNHCSGILPVDFAMILESAERGRHCSGILPMGLIFQNPMSF